MHQQLVLRIYKSRVDVQSMHYAAAVLNNLPFLIKLKAIYNISNMTFPLSLTENGVF